MSTSGKNAAVAEQRPAKMHWYPFWSPRFWDGMRFGVWLQLLAENRFRVDPRRLPMAVLITLFTPFNSTMARIQRWRHAEKIRRTPIDQPPLFIIGHWRSGTTYLHELLARDKRFTYPTTYQCFAPEHFVVTEWLFAKYFGFLLPRRRPMDNVQAGWSRPQEDEFALMTAGARSPYRRMAFPNSGPVDMQYLDMEELTEEQLQCWQRTLLEFVQALTYKTGKRVVLKSPTHTGRIHVLARLFPGAQFIHVTRHPDSLFPSTCRLWKSLDQVQGCQVPHHRDLEDYVLTAFERMYASFHRHRNELAPEQLCDIRYEDLVAAPVASLQRIYEQLNLGDFETVRPDLVAYTEKQKSYQTNVYQLAPDRQAELRRRWADYFERYGYE